MDKNKFIEDIKDVLQTEEDIDFETNLDDIAEWDSLAHLAMSQYFNSNFNKQITLADYENIKSIKDLADIAGIK